MASATLKITVEKNLLPALARKLQTEAPRVVETVAMMVQAHAINHAPVDTGFLRASIQPSQIGALEWHVTVGADYGAYVEYGTRHMGARPFLTPAVEWAQPKFEQMVRDLVQL